jgi:Tfp pilus assembly protein PilE
MGQQQLLLIVLGVIVVGIAIVVGITMFQTSAVDANRNAITSDLTNLAARAFQHFKRPSALGGGNQYFDGFMLIPTEKSNNNGEYRITDATSAGTKVTSAPAATSGNTSVATGSNTATIYITGYGVETGEDGTNLVQEYITITGNSFNVTKIN